MALIVNAMPQPLLKAEELAQWEGIPTSIISDELNRSGTLNATVRPMSEKTAMVGQALTIQTMVADNLALHHAVAKASAGTVLMVDAGGFTGNAVWGGILHRASELRGVKGVVIDGCVRDIAELRVSTLPCYAIGIVPAGPHKAWGGTINGPVQIAGCPVSPGDLVVSDDDGVAVVPLDRLDSLLKACRARIVTEARVLERLAAGETTVEIFGLTS